MAVGRGGGQTASKELTARERTLLTKREAQAQRSALGRQLDGEHHDLREAACASRAGGVRRYRLSTFFSRPRASMDGDAPRQDRHTKPLQCRRCPWMDGPELAEQESGSQFLGLANGLSALYPLRRQEKRLLDARLLAVPW